MPASKHRRVVEAIRRQILSGHLAPGDRLPPTDELLREYGVDYVTLRAALVELEREGLIESRQGAGRYVVYEAEGEPTN
jgi:GntR family transcriptional regulator